MMLRSVIVPLGCAALFSIGCGSRTPTLAPLPAGVQAISFLGDTLRNFPLAPAARERYERQLGEARAAYERAPTNADSIVWYGRRLAYLGRIREAIDVYSRGIELHPDNAWLYRHRGHRYVTIRELDLAIKDFERATQLTAGKPDQVEPDGQPNAANTPIGTLQSNIAYHLGLAHYLKGDFARAIPVYRKEITDSRNDDRLVSTAHWLYMSLRRLGRDAEAADVLKLVRPTMNVIENDTYLRIMRLYRGELPVDSVLATTATGEMSVTDATAAYGIGNWHFYNGRRAEAEKIFRRVMAGGQWGAFGYIASEKELSAWGTTPSSQGSGTSSQAAGAQVAFWSQLQQLCGRAFRGRLTEGNASDSTMRRATLVMHVRGCTADEIRIPFHVDSNRSRTWVISRQPAGLRLKHDHRHVDGSEDAVTQYGGDTRGAVSALVQEFHADAHTATLIPAAKTNVWTMEIVPGKHFAYALRREGTDRKIRVEFDLASPISAPPPPWGSAP